MIDMDKHGPVDLDSAWLRTDMAALMIEEEGTCPWHLVCTGETPDALPLSEPDGDGWRTCPAGERYRVQDGRIQVQTVMPGDAGQ